MPAPVKESALVSIRCSAELNDRLDLAATMRGQSKSDVVRDLLFDGLKRMADPKEVQKLLEEEERKLNEATDQLRSMLSQN